MEDPRSRDQVIAVWEDRAEVIDLEVERRNGCVRIRGAERRSGHGALSEHGGEAALNRSG
jgi:hypothetical protein